MMRRKRSRRSRTASRLLRLETLEFRRLLAVVAGSEEAAPDGVAGPFLPPIIANVPGEVLANESGDDHDGHDHGDDGVLLALPPVGGAVGATNTNDGNIGAVGDIPSALYDPDNLPTNDAGLPQLESLPGASTAAFIDFDGWTSFAPFDTDGAPTTFNAAEQGRIWETWRQAAAFLSPFDVNVTTIEPDFATVPTNYELVSNSVSGGYSYLRFPSNRPYGFNQSGDAPNRTSGILHEIGHNYSLRHQSTFNDLGEETREYSYGDSNLEVPTLGVDFGGRMHRLYIGHTFNASDLQDDLAIIQSKIVAHTTNGGDGFRGDDHGESVATATPLVVDGLVQKGSGVIERLDDVDTFTFTIDPSTVSIYVRPERSSPLDVQLEVYDSAGDLVASGDQFELFEHIFLTADATETFTLQVRSHGDYGELGSYEIFVQPQADGFRFADTIDRFNYKNGALQNQRADATYDATGGEYKIHTASGDIWNSQDDMAYAYRPLVGDGQITVRVTENSATHAWTKAGVMIRESDARNSKHAFVAVTGNNGIAFQYRNTTGGSSSNTNTADGNRLGDYVRLTRSGNLFTAEYSSDGVNWTTLGSEAIVMNQKVLVGLAYTNQSTSTAHEATFDDLSVTGAITVAETAVLEAPTNVALSKLPQTSMVVSWDSVAGASDYLIRRSVDGFTWETVATVASSQSDYTMTGLDQHRRYFVTVHALDSSGARSPASNVVSATTRPGPVTGFRVSSYRTDQLVLDWNEANGEIGYRVLRSTDGTNWTNVAEMGAQVPSYTDTGLDADTQYMYRVTTLDSEGDAATSVTRTRQTRLGSMTGLQAVTTGPGTVQLTWNDTFNSETGFLIERQHESGGWATLATTAADSDQFIDSTVDQFGRYAYRVSPTHDYLPSPSQTIDHWMSGALALFEFSDSGDTLIDTGTAAASLPLASTSATRGVGRTTGGLTLNGSTSAMDLAQTASLHGDIDFSAGVWVKTTGASDAVLISQGGVTSSEPGTGQGGTAYVQGFDLRMLDDGTTQFRVASDRQSGSTFTLQSSESINDGYWHHVMAVREGDVGRLYVDGALADESAGAAEAFNGDLSVYVGFDGLTSDAYFGGDLDGVRISDSAMTVAEIQALIDSQNDAPTATSQTFEYEIDEDESVVIDLTSIASDADGDRLQGRLITLPSSGATEVVNGTWVYTPNLDYFGTDTFTFSVTDHFGADSGSISTVSVVIRPINDPPRTNDITIVVPEGTATLPIDLIGQTIDPEGESVSIDSVTQPAHGVVSLNAGIATYASLGGPFAGVDQFNYTASDSGGLTDSGTITLVTENLVHYWKLDESTGTTARDSVSPSGDAMADTVTWISGKNNGAVAFDGDDDALTSNAVLSNTLSGTASLAFWIQTTQVGTSVGWDSPGVIGIEQAGGQTDMQWGWIDGAGRIRITTPAGSGARSAVAINNGQWRHVVITRDAASGMTEVFVDGQLSDSRVGSTGTNTLQFNQLGVIADTGQTPQHLEGALDDIRIYDAVLSAADVSAIYNSLDAAPPGIADDVATTDEDTAVAIDVLGNDSLQVGEAFDRIASLPANGTVAVQGDGTILYTPDENFNGSDAFTYWVAGAGGLIDKATVAVTVTPVNDAPSSITVDNALLVENSDTASALLVGELSATDVDSVLFTFALVNGAGDTDNARFEVADGKLRLSAGQVIDYEEQSSYSVRLAVSDGDKSFEQTLNVSVENRLEASRVAIADDELGRSHLSEIIVEFDASVSLGNGAFVVEKIDTPVQVVPVTVATELVGGKTRASLSFSGDWVEANGSLKDGNYRLRIVGSEVTDSTTGQVLDGNLDGVAGGDFLMGDAAADRFYRLFSDGDGDGDVDINDYVLFSRTYNRSSSHDLYDIRFDFDGDGDVDINDYTPMARRYNTRLQHPNG